MFVVFEGVDGVGKTSQVKMLQKYFGKKAIIASESKSTSLGVTLGKRIKRELDNMSLLELIELKHIQRMAMLEEVVLPYMRKYGGVCICDRFTESTKAYVTALGGDIKHQTVLREKINLLPILPGRIDILLNPVDFITHKEYNSSDPFEARGTEFQERVRGLYLDQFSKLASSVVINVTKDMSPHHVHLSVLRTLKDKALI